MERKFIRSGIPGLDSILGGGMLEGSVITVSGPTGVGKSTLAAQFLYNGALESNEPGLYVCLEESRRDFLFHNSGYEWDFQALEKERRFILLDYPIHEVDQIVNQSAAIAEIINNTGTKRVVIDSIMPIALYFKTDEERKRGFLKLIDNLHKWNVTTMVVSEDIKMAHSGARPSSEYGIESFTDGWINLFYKYDERTMDRSRYLEIIKMKGIAHNHRAFPAVLGNSGFSVMHELTGAPIRQKAKPAPPQKPSEKPPEETVVSIEPGELTLPHMAMAEEEERPKPVPEAPLRPLSSKRKLVKDEEMEQLKKLLEEESAEKKRPAPKPGGEAPARPPPSGKPPAPPPKQAPAKAPAPKAPPKIAAKPSGRPAPAKMSPSIQARLEEVKKKIMKKK